MGTLSLRPVKPIFLRPQTRSRGKIEVFLGQGLPTVCPSGPRLGHPVTALEPPSRWVTHSAWFQGIGFTFELASRWGL